MAITSEKVFSNFPIITVCGSMRYYVRMLSAAEEFSRMGYIVLMPFVADFIGDPGKDKDNTGIMLDEMHMAKIDMSDFILVVGEHRGESTTREIKYAEANGKGAYYR